MTIQYFKSVWGDIKNSPGWFGKLCLLALLNFIPVFGQIVTFAYLYGWAREISWGTHEPLPQKVFSNEDGKFWRRGWFVFVLVFVFALIPYVFLLLGNYLQVIGSPSMRGGVRVVSNPVLGVVGGLVVFVGYAGMLLMSVLGWIGSMRVSIYDRLSAGFQFGKIWKMLRHDTTGILKIFGMSLLFGLIFGIILSIIFSILLLVVMFVGVAGLMSAGYLPQSVQYMTDAQAANLFMQFLASAGIVGFLALLVGCFAALVSAVFIQMLTVRAMGYWTMQFEVAKWGVQDDPLPFEKGPAAVQSQQPPVYAAVPTQDQSQWQAQQNAQPQWQPSQETQPQWSSQGQAPGQPTPPQWQASQGQAPVQPAQPQWQPPQGAQPAQPQPAASQFNAPQQPVSGQPDAVQPPSSAQPDAQPSAPAQPDVQLPASEANPEGDNSELPQ